MSQYNKAIGLVLTIAIVSAIAPWMIVAFIIAIATMFFLEEERKRKIIVEPDPYVPSEPAITISREEKAKHLRSKA